VVPLHHGVRAAARAGAGAVDVVQVQAVVSKVVVVAQALWLTLFFNVQLKRCRHAAQRRLYHQRRQVSAVQLDKHNKKMTLRGVRTPTRRDLYHPFRTLELHSSTHQLEDSESPEFTPAVP